MATALFDSRKLTPTAYFGCKLPLGDYVLASAEFPTLHGAITVGARDDEHPGSTSATLTSDAQGNLMLSPDIPSPIRVQEGAILLFDYFAERDDAISYSLQISGEAGASDSRTLMTDELFGYLFSTAGIVIYKAYLLVAGFGGAAPQYMLKQQGEIRVRDDAPIGDPVLIVLAGDAPQPITIPTYSAVTWQARGGPWYILATIDPPLPQQPR